MKCPSNEFPETLNTKPIIQALSFFFLLLVKMSSHSLIHLLYLLNVKKKKRVKETQLKSNQYRYPILVDGIYKFYIFSLTVILCNVIFTSSA